MLALLVTAVDTTSDHRPHYFKGTPSPTDVEERAGEYLAKV